MPLASLMCTKETFCPCDTSQVRWLDWEKDYPLAQAYWPKEYPLTRDIWDGARQEGYRYCAIIEHGAIAA